MLGKVLSRASDILNKSSTGDDQLSSSEVRLISGEVVYMMRTGSDKMIMYREDADTLGNKIEGLSIQEASEYVVSIVARALTSSVLSFHNTLDN